MKIFESRLSLLFKSESQSLCSLLYVKTNSLEGAKQTHIDYINSRGYSNGDINKEVWNIKECNEEKLNKKFKVKHSEYFGDWDYVKLQDMKVHKNGIMIHSYNEEVYNKFMKQND